MSLYANIEHLAAASGIEAVEVETTKNPRAFRGDENWKGVLDGALGIFALTEEPTIRMVVGRHTVVVQKENEEVVAVILPTGHAIAKSLRRMIRRMAKKDRGPLPAKAAAAPEPVAPSAPAAQPPGVPKAPDVKPDGSGAFRF